MVMETDSTIQVNETGHDNRGGRRKATETPVCENLHLDAAAVRKQIEIGYRAQDGTD